MNIKSLLKNKTVKNTGWLIGGKVAYTILSFVVGVFTANYLGPSNQGLIDYAMAFTVFFYSICTLGISSIIVKNFIDYPEEEGKTLGTAIGLRFISSFISMVIIIGIVLVADYGEKTTIIVAVLVSSSLCFQVFDAFNEWFQNRLESKFSSIATLIGYVLVSVYRIILLVTGGSIYLFALSHTVDYVGIALFLIIAYKKKGGPKLSFSKEKAKQLLKSSYHFILSGLMISVYNATDKLMLKHMVSQAEVGFYSRANSLCTMWCFVLAAIITSVTPNIIKHFKAKNPEYQTRNRQLYCVVFYVSVLVSLIFTFLGKWIISILYTPEYLPAYKPLQVLTWLTGFSYLGVARNVWVVCEEKQKYLKWLYLVAAISNVGLNIAFIPLWGAVGAAVASVITQALTAIVVPLFIKPLRPNAKMMLEAIVFKGVFKRKNTIKEGTNDAD